MCRTPHLTTNKEKYKFNHQQTGLPPHSALPIRGKTNKQKLSTNLIQYKAYTNHWTNLRRVETKRKREFNLEGRERETSNTIKLKKNNEKAEKYYTNKRTN